MAWSLVEALAEPAPKRRPFYLPLASVPPDATTVRAVDADQFVVAESTSDPDDPYLRIDIEPIGGNEGLLPDPAIRLHAMVPGTVRFAPASGNLRDRLILRMPFFCAPLDTPWWTQWRNHPMELIYENVDTFMMEQMLYTSTLPGRLVAPGLSLPLDADPVQKTDFLGKFFAGTPGYTLTAVAGAVLGQADQSPDDPQKKQLRLHVRYDTDSVVEPRPMHPREFFCLLFGNDSAEFTEGAAPSAHIGHPLLLAIQAKGEATTNVMPSKTLRLRPPLHTFKRVLWEAAWELRSASKTNWKKSGSLGTDHLFNTYSKLNALYNRGTYKGWWKCNIFVFDVCLRAGFRVAVHDAATAWHYVFARTACNLVHAAYGTNEVEPVNGIGETGSHTWARNIERWLTATPATTTSDARLNDAIDRQGRCFILAGGRKRVFVNSDCGSAKGVMCKCAIDWRSGHIVIIRHVNAAPSIPVQGEGVHAANVDIIEAAGNGGASNGSGLFQVGGNSNSADGRAGFTRLQILELEPGGDPGTVWGIQDLNARCASTHDWPLRSAAETAPTVTKTHDEQGNPIVGKCCKDNWPTTNNVSVITC